MSNAPTNSNEPTLDGFIDLVNTIRADTTDDEFATIAAAIPAVVAAHRAGWRPNPAASKLTTLELARLIKVLFDANGKPVEPATTEDRAALQARIRAIVPHADTL